MKRLAPRVPPADCDNTNTVLPVSAHAVTATADVFVPRKICCVLRERTQTDTHTHRLSKGRCSENTNQKTRND